jgi:hypothetical protein
VSIKDDVKYVKKELSGDEKVLESAFKLETIYNKYKFIIWAVVVAVILFFVGTTVMKSMEQFKLEDANTAFLTLQQNPKDTAALETLKKKNPSLFELYTFSQAAHAEDTKALEALQNSKNDIISDASKYTVAVTKREPVDSKLYAELSLIQEAYVLIKSGDSVKAKAKLQLIDERSTLHMLSKLLEHSMIKAK